MNTVKCNSNIKIEMDPKKQILQLSSIYPWSDAYKLFLFYGMQKCCKIALLYYLNISIMDLILILNSLDFYPR